MRAKDLILRKGQLRESKTNILKQIAEETADMNRVDLESFIASGDPGQVNGHNLNKLQRKHQHLLNLEGSLNLEISKLRKKERLTSLQKLERKAAELEAKRKGSLYAKYLHFQEKIKVLEKESIKLKAEALEITNKAGEFKREMFELHFRLPELEQFLEEHYVQCPEELEELVREAYQENEIRLRQTVTMIAGGQFKTFILGEHKTIIGSDQLIRGFQKISLNRDTGQIEKIEATTCGVDVARENPNIMAEVKK